MNKSVIAIVLLLALGFAGCGDQAVPTPAPAASAPIQPAPVSFAQNVGTVFVSKCAGCHIKDSKGGLSLETFASLMKGGTNGAVVIPGKPDESSLVQLIESGKMPAKGDPLNDSEKANIREWVAKGAKFDGEKEDVKLADYIVVEQVEQAGGRGGRGGGGWDPVAQFDKDADGKLSKEEAPDRMKESFDEIDTDKDGAITTEEFQARMRSRTGGRGRGGDRTRGGPPERSGEAARGGSTGDTGTKAGSKDRPQRPAFDE
ncbi:MAG: c-type cytochrome domain-containing protein [Verrucomicrobiia bacterium]|jgi:mono/diheme cytochrome c family protein